MKFCLPVSVEIVKEKSGVLLLWTREKVVLSYFLSESFEEESFQPQEKYFGNKVTSEVNLVWREIHSFK